MKDKSRILLELEGFKQLHTELTAEVDRLNSQLQKERSTAKSGGGGGSAKSAAPAAQASNGGGGKKSAEGSGAKSKVRRVDSSVECRVVTGLIM